MSIADKVFSGDTLRVGYRFQRHWDNSMAYAFCCAELGAGLFFVSLLLDSTTGMVIGLIPVATGKPYFHLAHMGVPMKSWRAILRPDRSWISRGLLGLMALLGFGGLLVLCLLFGEQFGVAADSTHAVCSGWFGFRSMIHGMHLFRRVVEQVVRPPPRILSLVGQSHTPVPGNRELHIQGLRLRCPRHVAEFWTTTLALQDSWTARRWGHG